MNLIYLPIASIACATGRGLPKMSDPINHPDHYGGKDNPYECIKVVEAWGLGFCLGSALKYICRAGKKGDALEDLKKAAWYLNREIQALEEGHG